MSLALAVLSLALGQAVSEPLFGNPEPEYPEAARRLLVTGDVTFRARISPSGHVGDVLVLGVPAPGLGFEDAVREAVLRWRFEPTSATAYFLGTHSFRLRPDDERELRALAASARQARFHDAAAVFLGKRVYRRTPGPWLSDRELASLEGRVRAIDFAAGGAAEVILGGGGRIRVLKVAGTWEVVSWESEPAEIDVPEKIEDVLPVFPHEARAARREDVVVLQALIGHSGAVQFLDVVTSVPELDEAAMTAAQKWRFRPARRKGVAIPFVTTLTVGFRGETY